MPLVAADARLVPLVRELERIPFKLGPGVIERCARYGALLIQRNTDVNLTAITEPADIARKHFADSFSALAVRRWTGRERLIDVGSGAGFPGR